MEPTLWIAAALIGAGGVLALRQAWRKGSSGPRGVLILGGWTALAIAIALAARAGGFDVGAGIGVCAMMVFAYGVITAGVQIRSAKRRSPKPAADPLDASAGPRRPWRVAGRTLIAAVLAAVAGFTTAAAIAICLPAVPITRAMTAIYLLPILWGAAVAWALADDRLLRPTLALTLVSLASWGAIALKSLP